MLLLVVSVLVVSYASSMRAYLQQRAQIDGLKTQIAEKSHSIDSLEREKRRWKDPAFVQAQARERFGYLMPGETSYVVLGANGKPVETQASLSKARDVLHRTPKAWWDTAWSSVELAGDPSKSTQ